jgi:hypothetical protein
MQTHIRLIAVIISVVALAPVVAAIQKNHPHTNRASGTFDVVLTPLPFDDKAEDGISTRMSLAKQFRGDLEGTSKGQMLAAGTTVEGSGAYVAIERINGTVRGRSGTFVLQHSGWMTKAGMHMNITVVPDSGTGQLTGLSGTMTIKIVGDKHFYDFEYTLPESAGKTGDGDQRPE